MKSTLKKVLFSLWSIWVLWLWSVWLVNADSWTNSFWQPGWFSWEWVHDLNVTDKGASYDSNNLINTIKRFINWVLWMLSLIALVICLRGWFQMLTASGDEGKYKKWFTILKQAAIALAVIWLSWLFVTLILYLINNSAQSA